MPTYLLHFALRSDPARIRIFLAEPDPDLGKKMFDSHTCL